MKFGSVQRAQVLVSSPWSSGAELVFQKLLELVFICTPSPPALQESAARHCPSCLEITDLTLHRSLSIHYDGRNAGLDQSHGKRACPVIKQGRARRLHRPTEPPQVPTVNNHQKEARQSYLRLVTADSTSG